MNTYWAFVRTDQGFMRVTVQAPDPFTALNMFKGMYGDKVCSNACPV